MACEQKVDIGTCSTSGTNTTANHTNYVVQYPKPYRRTDGKWIAIGSIIGTIFGGYANQDIVEKAEDAEDEWRFKIKTIGDRGEWMFGDHADKLLACVDDLHEKLCAVAQCGYKPNYETIAIRTRAIAMSSYELERKKLCRVTNRYRTGFNADAFSALALAQVQAVTTALTTTIEKVRLEAFSLNLDLLRTVTDDFESDFIARVGTGADLVRNSISGYRDIADSYRKTAKESASDLATLGSLLGFLIPMLISAFSEDEDACTPTPEPTP